MRTRIISDLHLGHPASRLTDPALLAPVFEGVDRVILAGDIWQEMARGSEGEVAARKHGKLLEMLAERGIVVESLWGNHDPGSEKGVARLAEGAVLATHGDAIYENATPWAREFPRCREEVDEIVSSYDFLTGRAERCAERAREIAGVLSSTPLPRLPVPLNYFATALWPPGRMFEMLRVWCGMGEEGLRFLARAGGGARVLVCGHFHRAGIWERDGRVMVNTGSFMRGGQAWAVDVSDGKLTARQLDFAGGRYVPGEVKGRWLLTG